MSSDTRTTPHFYTRAGTVSIDPSTKRILVLFDPMLGKHRLPSDQTHVGESFADAAVRAVNEKTGHTCTLIAHKLPTSATTTSEGSYHTEPIALQVQPSPDIYTKSGTCFWFVAKTDSSSKQAAHNTANYEVCWFTFDNAKRALSSIGQHTIVGRALEAAAEVLSAKTETTSVKNEAESEDGEIV